MGADRRRLIAGEQAPFQTLVKMIEHELELAGRGQLQELRAAVTRTGEYMATLPTPAPDSAQQLVERAKALRGRVTIEAERLRDGVDRSRSSLRRSRQIARRYGRPSDNRYSTTV
jgi:hypothetical protein